MEKTTILEKEHSQTFDMRETAIPCVWVPCSREISAGNGQRVSTLSNIQREADVISNSKNNGLSPQLIADMLESARYTAILCSFLLADKTVEQAIHAAAERGVRIYLMLACETRLDKDNPDDEFEKKCRDQHVSMLKRLAGRVMIRSAPHYHAKAVLIDAIGPNQAPARGLLLTANLTSEALERNEELAVFLNGPETKEVVETLRWAFFENAEHQMLDNRHFKSVKPLGEVRHPLSSHSILTTTRESNSIKTYALKLIESATQSLIISSFGWQEEHEITNAICKKAEEGINVTILTRIRPSSMKTLMMIQSAGARVYGFPWLHAKAIWKDADQAMLMSANLQYHGLDAGFEIGIKLEGNRAQSLKNRLLGFLDKSRYELVIDAKLGKLNGAIKVWDSGRLLDIEIEKRVEKKLPPVKAICVSKRDEKPNFPISPGWEEFPFHEIEYQWSVKSPRLPKGAKEVFWEEKKSVEEEKPTEEEENGEKTQKRKKKKYKTRIIKHSHSPKVFQTNSVKVIAISNSKEIQDAINLRDEKFPNASIVVL